MVCGKCEKCFVKVSRRKDVYIIRIPAYMFTKEEVQAAVYTAIKKLAEEKTEEWQNFVQDIGRDLNRVSAEIPRLERKMRQYLWRHPEMQAGWESSVAGGFRLLEEVVQ
jgi:uncharacterized protein YicC (UPF0701 family)